MAQGKLLLRHLNQRSVNMIIICSLLNSFIEGSQDGQSLFKLEHLNHFLHGDNVSLNLQCSMFNFIRI